MNNKIKLDIISDVVCPWCVIGYKRLEEAITEMGIQDKVEISWQAFELNPNMPMEGEDILEHVNRKYGSTPEQWRNSQANMQQLGKEVDFTFEFVEGKRIVNTRDAHVLLAYAKESGKQTELKMRLFEAYFSQGKNVSDREILLEEIKHIGLDADAAKEILENEDCRKQIIDKEAFWRNKGISSVPTIVINQSSSLVGSQTVDVYKQILTDLLNQNVK
ncbi:DsbA family oxidoreductase [Ancylomarina sp. 16SWW S1-10-2]|uniref:DsbA family oxidoreductase n=1 Tax=Ancylomarina sp. 16SWW S1-10-2 TaxID=2499681 RepID=UPI0012AE5A2A|nr:DsbA family oxidoreductase [Ancylomarina sp. 16SWW S1-10-2]MRT92650.1 DsbA family oxidoreductase [Ancylomarina sp. 16SWW S1-10-2]